MLDLTAALLENGADIAYIQEFLGHNDIRTTGVYIAATTKGQRRLRGMHPRQRRIA